MMLVPSAPTVTPDQPLPNLANLPKLMTSRLNFLPVLAQRTPALRKLLAGFDLGTDLRQHRKASKLTQGQLASRVALAERTIRLLEQGRGNLDSWKTVLDHLDLELTGRNLPAGSTLGERLASLRRHRGMTVEGLVEDQCIDHPH